MKKYKYLLILLNLAVLLWVFNSSVVQKENVLNSGKLVFLKLSPLDTIQRVEQDFVNLHYPILDVSYSDSLPKRGFCLMKTDENGMVSSFRLQSELLPHDEQEFPVAFVTKNGSINIGATACYFKKGQLAKFTTAKYAGLKVGEKGNSVLFGLYDEYFQLIN